MIMVPISKVIQGLLTLMRFNKAPFASKLALMVGEVSNGSDNVNRIPYDIYTKRLNKVPEKQSGL